MMTYLLPVVFMAVACKRPPATTAAAAVENRAVAGSISADPAAIEELQANFERVHFALDSASLTLEAQEALDANASILQEYPRLQIEVQGHADERGTVDYNLALGQRRARSVVDFLARQGIASTRLSVVSFGEERPLRSGSSEVAWAANRRAEFRVIEGPAGARGTVE